MPILNSNRIIQHEFPPTIGMVRQGILLYREARGFEQRGMYPYNTMRRALVGREFETVDKRYRVVDIRFHEIAPPIGPIGDVEGNFELVIPGVAAAHAAIPFLGSGKKNEADGAATYAMRTALNKISIRGINKGGEGSGRDAMGKEAAIYLGEPLGTGYGPRVDILEDPLEVTNQAKPLKLEAGEFKGGEGWHPDLINPDKWYPGYSGALSLFAAVNAEGNIKGGIRKLTDDLYLNKMFLPWELAARGLNLNSSAEELIEAVSQTYECGPAEIRAAALGRSRHRFTFESWTAERMIDDNIYKPTDGDSMFAWAIASGLIHFGGLTGGVMEAVIGGMAGVPVGCNMSFQFVSHSKLKEEEASADLLREDHKFGFNGNEFDKMIPSELYDGQHLGSLLRRLSPTSPLLNTITNAAFAEIEIPDFNGENFLREMTAVTITGGIRFSDPSRSFLSKILEREGWWDVRKVARLGDFRTNRDTMYFATALTPNKWAPLEGIRGGNGKITSDSLFVGGSQTVFVMETDVAEI